MRSEAAPSAGPSGGRPVVVRLAGRPAAIPADRLRCEDVGQAGQVDEFAQPAGRAAEPERAAEATSGELQPRQLVDRPEVRVLACRERPARYLCAAAHEHHAGHRVSRRHLTPTITAAQTHLAAPRTPTPAGLAGPPPGAAFPLASCVVAGQLGWGREMGATVAFAARTRSPGASSISSPRRPALQNTVGYSSADESMTTGSRLRWPSGEMPPAT